MCFGYSSMKVTAGGAAILVVAHTGVLEGTHGMKKTTPAKSSALPQLRDIVCTASACAGMLSYKELAASSGQTWVCSSVF